MLFTIDTKLDSILRSSPQRWLVTGGAGFIGSHLAETLLSLGQSVSILDDFSTGKRENIPDGARVFVGDVRDASLCNRACADVDIVLHHAAIGSVIKSIEDPSYVDSINVGGTRTVLEAAIKHGAKRFVFASSSAVYGDSGRDICVEDQTLHPKSPYAEGKLACEKILQQACKERGIAAVSLRYFNVYGARQDPNGVYAAVIPHWIDAAVERKPIVIYGDGGTIRDFCYIKDVVEANIRAALCDPAIVSGNVYNIASGIPTSLNDLFQHIKSLTGYDAEPAYKQFRDGDIRVSCASINKAVQDLDYSPKTGLNSGLESVVSWFKAGG